MSVSDFDIHRLAHLFIQSSSSSRDQPTAKARKMVEETRRKGDHEGAHKWLRITGFAIDTSFDCIEFLGP
jgi:hypothetical protein